MYILFLPSSGVERSGEEWGEEWREEWRNKKIPRASSTSYATG